MKRVLLSLIVSGIYAGGMAIPAKPGLTEFIQPDGSVINIQLIGDEHGHMIYSEDGLLLIEVGGRLEYASFDSNGFPIASGIQAVSGGAAKVGGRITQTEEHLKTWGDKIAAARSTRVPFREAEGFMSQASTRSGKEGDGRLVPEYFARCASTFPTTGEQKALVILVEFADVAFEFGDYDYFNRMLNEDGFSDFGSLGSARDWFKENSGGKFLPDFDVYGPIKLPKERAFYGENNQMGNDAHPYDMVIDACTLLDDEVDFAQYDRDGDGVIDNVFIFYAGIGEHDSSVAEAVWPHSWELSIGLPYERYFYDEVQLNHYACTCEHPYKSTRPDGIGTFIHEFSHVMGLPDLYVTSRSTAFTPGEWSVMDQGPYNNDRLTPPNYSSYEKCSLGWIDMQPFTDGRMEIPDLTETNVAYALPTDKDTEFYFFENRQQRGNDAFLPGHGMLVWHVDYREGIWATNSVNNTSTHQYVDLIEADNVKSNSTRAADPFPGRKKITSFGFETNPRLASWSKARLAYDLEDIAESEEGLISFNAVANTEWNAVDAIEEADADGVYYDLTGRRVANPGKGIYIRNGKKIIVNN